MRCLHLALAHGAQQIGQYSLGDQQTFAAVESLIGDIPSQPPGNKLSAYNDLATTGFEDIILLLKEALEQPR